MSLTRKLLLVVLLGSSLLDSSCTSYRGPNPGVMPAMDSAPVEYSGGLGYGRANYIDTGIFVPDGRGGLVWVPGQPRIPYDPAYAAAQELRLKAREIAAQLLEVSSGMSLAGVVALPTSFVDLNDFSYTSPLGRYLAEAMFYEFNQRGVDVREYRIDGKIHLDSNREGEFALTRNLPPLKVKERWSAILMGTYLRQASGIFINARLVRPRDGMVLRTAQLVLASNPMLAKMTTPPPLSSGTLRILPGHSKNSKQTARTARPKPVTEKITPANDINRHLEIENNVPVGAAAVHPSDSEGAITYPGGQTSTVPDAPMPGSGRNT